VLAVLRASFDQATAGRGHLVLIGGEAGIGKTAVAGAAADWATAQGALVLWGRCSETEGVPAFGHGRRLSAPPRRRYHCPDRAQAGSQRPGQRVPQSSLASAKRQISGYARVLHRRGMKITSKPKKLQVRAYDAVQEPRTSS